MPRPYERPCLLAHGDVHAHRVVMRGETNRGWGTRGSSRLPRYDYASPGSYFVTICARDMECLFGSVGSAGEVTLNEWGQVVDACWLAIPEHFPDIALDTRVTMPNHLHGIVVVEELTGNARMAQASQSRARHASPRSLGVIVGSFKSAVTKRIRQMGAGPDETVWQRGYYEHIIRDGDDLQRVRRYIETNPTRWAQRP